MATKTFIIEVEEGMTKCGQCPDVFPCGGTDPIHCCDYNIATMKIKEVDKDAFRKYADGYSYDLWELLMGKFKANDDFYIGANDVFDYVFNAMLDAYKKIIEEEK